MAKRKKKFWLIIGGAVVVVAVIVANLTMNSTHATPVQAEQATSREVVETVSASGRVQPQTKVNITSEINGEIIGLYVHEGDRVKLGQELVQLDTVQVSSDARQAKYAVNEIEARLAGAKTTLEQNQDEYNRQEQLYNNKLTSETEYKNARYAFLNAKSAYQAMQAQARQAESAYAKQVDYLSKTKIVAPMAGVITFLDAEVGEIAAAQTAFTQGKTLMTISNLDVFEVDVNVDETEISKVKVHQPANIEIDAFPDTTFKGEVTEIGNTAITTSAGTSDQSTNFLVKVIFQEADKNIRPGMSATVDITTARRENALSVPYSAVVIRSVDADSLKETQHKSADSGGSSEVQAAENPNESTTVAGGTAGQPDKREELKGVFVIHDGKAKFVKIETGIADQKYIEVTSGLNKGDSVVAGPYRVLRTIHPGQAVAPEKPVKETR